MITDQGSSKRTAIYGLVRLCLQKPGLEKSRTKAIKATAELGSAPLIWNPILNLGELPRSNFTQWLAS